MGSAVLAYLSAIDCRARLTVFGIWGFEISLWPGLSRPSTSFSIIGAEDVDARDKPGHDELEKSQNISKYSRVFLFPPALRGRVREGGKPQAPDSRLTPAPALPRKGGGSAPWLRRRLRRSKHLEIFALLPLRHLSLEALDFGGLDVNVVVDKF